MSLSEVELPPERVRVSNSSRTVEVQTVDGEHVWLFVPNRSFGDIAHQLVRDRHIMGRHMGRAGDEFDGHRILIPIERIMRLVDVDN